MAIFPPEPRMAGVTSKLQDVGASEGRFGGHGGAPSVWPDFLKGQADCPVRVLLVDLHLGDGEGFELLDYMKTVRPSAEAVVISVMENDDEVLRAFERGATGYLGKNSWFGNYPQAVLQVVNGGASITPNLARRLLQRFDKTHVDQPTRHESVEVDRLSDREKEVLRMVASGYTSAEIATNLLISGMTVNTHIRNIYRKLQVRTRAQAVRFASLRGLF